MATRRKRRSTSRRRVHRAASNPRRRRRATVRSRRSVSLFKPRRRRTRRRNPVLSRRRRGGRRRNPVGGGLVGEAINFAVAGFAIGVAQRIIAGFVPNFGVFTVPVTSAATGFGLGWLAGFTQFTRPFKRPLQIMGFALAITTLAGPLVRQIMGSFGGQAQPQGGMGGPRYGMRGIAAVPNTLPPGMALAPPLPQRTTANGMQGIGAYPTVGAFRR